MFEASDPRCVMCIRNYITIKNRQWQNQTDEDRSMSDAVEILISNADVYIADKNIVVRSIDQSFSCG